MSNHNPTPEEETSTEKAVIAERINGYVMKVGTPELRPEVERFARGVLRSLEPSSAGQAAQWLSLVARYGMHLAELGYELKPSEVFKKHHVDRYVENDFLLARPNGSRAAVRRVLYAAGRKHAARTYPKGLKPIPRAKSKRPYTKDEIERYLHMARSQKTRYRRMTTCSSILLAAGAGLALSEAKWVRGCDIVKEARRILVDYKGPSPRRIEVLPAYRKELYEIAQANPDKYLLGRNATTTRDLSGRIKRDVHGKDQLPDLNFTRLRDSWLLHHLKTIEFDRFLILAGLNSASGLDRILPFLKQDDDDTGAQP